MHEGMWPIESHIPRSLTWFAKLGATMELNTSVEWGANVLTFQRWEAPHLGFST